MPHFTIPALLCRTVDARGDDPALLVPTEGEYQTIRWRELAQQAACLAAAIRERGVAPGDRVAHVSENRYEWILTDLALHLARAVHVPIHVTLSAEQIAYQVRHSDAKLVLVSRPELLAGFAAKLQDEPRGYVLFDAPSQQIPAAQRAETMDELTAAGDPQAWESLLPQAASESSEDDLTTILYTSGTTGEPKGVMLTQENLASNSVATADAVGGEEDELRLGFLPLSHIYARTCDLYMWVYQGSRLALAKSRDSVLADCQAVHPEVLNGVPYFYEKLVQGLIAGGAGEQTGALKQLLGGKIRRCYCGGAALPAHVAEFFAQQDVPLLPGYGLTESSPVIAVALPETYRVGAVGPPIPGIEVRIAEDGEILTRGPHIMRGYWKNDAATAETVRDGWLHTGDLGEFDEAGNLAIRGRKKEIIVLATGKNVAPAYVEGMLTSSPLIEQAFVVGDDRRYLAALIVPNELALKEELAGRGQANDPGPARDLLGEEITRCLDRCAHEEQVRAFSVLDRGFCVEKGELTAKLSLRRDVIASHFQDQISSMYGADD